MALEQYRVDLIRFDSARPFLRRWHYEKYQNVQCKYSFGLFRPGNFDIPEMVGVCVYTLPAGPTAGQSYCPEAPEKVLELRRLACIDETPKNTESFFVSKTLKWLKKNTDYRVIISYADPEHGHTGVIYKASNFELVGRTSPGTAIEYGGKRFHNRTITMLDRPYGRRIHQLVKEKSDLITHIELQPKYIYRYNLR
jgi:hypothetical protein